MISIRNILADNIRMNRKKLKLSQAKLAEKAETGTQYIAMIEVSRKFPSPEMLERIAKALNIEAYELFKVELSQEDALEQLGKNIVSNIEQVVSHAVEKAITTTCQNCRSKDI